MFDKHHKGKIKNEKFLHWRLELSCFYRPDSLFKLHEAVCLDVSTNSVLKCLTSLFSLVGMPAYVRSDQEFDLSQFLFSKGVASSQTTSYNPERNGQAEKYNGMIWKGVTMSLKSKNLLLKNWQDILPDVLHFVHSLLCTATNETPHERFFGLSRRSSAGPSIPTWLATPGPDGPYGDEVELLQANPHYTHVCYPDGRETTVANHATSKPCAQSDRQHDAVMEGLKTTSRPTISFSIITRDSNTFDGIDC